MKNLAGSDQRIYYSPDEALWYNSRNRISCIWAIACLSAGSSSTWYYPWFIFIVVISSMQMLGKSVVKVTAFAVVHVYPGSSVFHHDTMTSMPDKVLRVFAICGCSISIDSSMDTDLWWQPLLLLIESPHD